MYRVLLGLILGAAGAYVLSSQAQTEPPPRPIGPYFFHGGTTGPPRWTQEWTYCEGDLTGDLAVGLPDFRIVEAHLGETCPENPTP